MKIILIIYMLVGVVGTTVCAQETEYYSYLQKFIDQAKRLQTTREKQEDISYKQFDEIYKRFNNTYKGFSDKYFMQTLDSDTPYYRIPSYKAVKAIQESMRKCSRNIYLDELDKADQNLGTRSYSGLNKNKFWKNLDQYFADIEKLKIAIAEEKASQTKT